MLVMTNLNMPQALILEWPERLFFRMEVSCN